MTLLKVAGMTKSYGGVRAVRDVSFELQRGEMLALIGPNGAGKSTTFAMVGGQHSPDAGSVLLDGADVTGLPPRVLARRGVGRTFQVAATFASMTVAENVQLAISAHRSRTRDPWSSGAKAFREEALAVLARVDMVGHADRPSASAS